LAEVMMCVAISGVIFAGILAGYVQSAQHVERAEPAPAVVGFIISQPE
jgi:hypothetical protein